MCVGCGETKVVAHSNYRRAPKIEEMAKIVGKSDDPNAKVGLRFYGGGLVRQPKSGCSGCGSGNSYAMQTTKTIMFASEDSPNGMFKMTFESGHDYYVTKRQAERLLTMTYQSQGGQTVNMFKKIPYNEGVIGA